MPTGFLYERLKKDGQLQRQAQQGKKRQKKTVSNAEKEVSPSKRTRMDRGGSCAQNQATSSDCKASVAKKPAVFQRSRMFYAPSSSEKFHPGC